MKIQGIVFDLDGVIVHTDKFHYQAWKRIADKMNLDFNEQINNRLRGVSRMDSLDVILEHNHCDLSLPEKELLADEKNEYYRELLYTLQPEAVSPEVLTTLNELKRNGLKLAIGSSSKNAKLILERIGLFDFFDAISDGNNITNSKPDPEVFIKAAGYIRLNPEECMVIEDAIAGIQAAKAGGMTAVAIGDAVNSELADEKLTTFADLISIIKKPEYN